MTERPRLAQATVWTPSVLRRLVALAENGLSDQAIGADLGIEPGAVAHRIATLPELKPYQMPYAMRQRPTGAVRPCQCCSTEFQPTVTRTRLCDRCFRYHGPHRPDGARSGPGAEGRS